ncbi:hypothetical protein QJS10_CPA03g00561 [Acorus calamus]|uniref:Core-2/I-branching beta-1,6-N-acetylglucosaminyltransferase family protein n=1 Tax=Acorus calamus TaxID=4465 RepID=A0AAV9F5R8_ACOCL|nr:hypothetical protein QJS10_CPA03g00561 [Acorus calamus]
MKSNQQQEQEQQAHHLNRLFFMNSSSMQLFNLLSASLLFGFGFALGIIVSLCLQQGVSFHFQTTQLVLPSPSPPPPQPPLPPPQGLNAFAEPWKAWHGMTDEELMWRASMSPRIERYPYQRVPKVAFMFLTKGPLALLPLWEMFFKGAEGRYSIYVHAHPSFNETAPKGSVFHERRVPSKVVEWGKLNMLEAERRLLANALLDFSNQRFILLSEACIPLFDFSTIYDYLINSTKNNIESYDDPTSVGRGRYNPHMNPHIRLDQWRKGSQWFEMDRNLALEVVADNRFFPVFAKYCRPSCYVDEHYIPTFVNIRFWLRNSNRTLTWVDWSKGGPHPRRFGRTEVTPELLESMRNGKECLYNGRRTNMCNLFARKFMPNTLYRLMKFAPQVMGYGHN